MTALRNCIWPMFFSCFPFPRIPLFPHIRRCCCTGAPHKERNDDTKRERMYIFSLASQCFPMQYVYSKVYIPRTTTTNRVGHRGYRWSSLFSEIVGQKSYFFFLPFIFLRVCCFSPALHGELLWPLDKYILHGLC